MAREPLFKSSNHQRAAIAVVMVLLLAASLGLSALLPQKSVPVGSVAPPHDVRLVLRPTLQLWRLGEVSIELPRGWQLLRNAAPREEAGLLARAEDEAGERALDLYFFTYADEQTPQTAFTAALTMLNIHAATEQAPVALSAGSRQVMLCQLHNPEDKEARYVAVITVDHQHHWIVDYRCPNTSEDYTLFFHTCMERFFVHEATNE